MMGGIVYRLSPKNLITDDSLKSRKLVALMINHLKDKWKH